MFGKKNHVGGLFARECRQVTYLDEQFPQILSTMLSAVEAISQDVGYNVLCDREEWWRSVRASPQPLDTITLMEAQEATPQDRRCNSPWYSQIGTKSNHQSVWFEVYFNWWTNQCYMAISITPIAHSTLISNRYSISFIAQYNSPLSPLYALWPLRPPLISHSPIVPSIYGTRSMRLVPLRAAMLIVHSPLGHYPHAPKNLWPVAINVLTGEKAHQNTTPSQSDPNPSPPLKAPVWYSKPINSFQSNLSDRRAQDHLG